MMRHLIAALVLCVGATIPVLGQTTATPDSLSLGDSLRADGDEAGRAAARERGVGAYFAASFLGGVPAGIFLPVGELGFGGAGLGVIAATTVAAGRSDRLPDEVALLIAQENADYQNRFRAAYAQQLSRRRTRASLLGGAVGVGTGVGVLALLLSQIDDF